MFSQFLHPVTFILVLLWVSACSPESTGKVNSAAADASILATASEQINIKIKVDDNGVLEPCSKGKAQCYTATLTIQLAEQMPLDWRIIFSHLSPISAVHSEQFNLIHLNGDLHEITSKHSDLDANQPYTITFSGDTPLVSESVLFPNYLLIAKNGDAKVIPSTLEQLLPGHQLPRPSHVQPFTTQAQQLRGPQDRIQIASAQSRFDNNQARYAHASNTPEQLLKPRVIPQVKQANWSENVVSLAQGLKLPNTASDIQPALTRLEKVGLTLTENGLPITFLLSDSLGHESYQLTIAERGIEIQHGSLTALHYALYSLAQLYNTEASSLPLGSIADEPAMPFRGLHLDVSRNFRDKAFIFKLLEQMAYYKLNKLHLHLADDEGWRLEIPSLPELTEVGAYRCADVAEQRCLLPQLAGGNGAHSSTLQNSGYYTQSDYIEILKFAKARHIEVIPSLDMPGHSRAAIVAMQARHNRYSLIEDDHKATEFQLSESRDNSQYRSIQHYNDNTLNPCLPATYRFIQEVLNQLVSMHQSAEVKLQRYHIGADETAGAWQQSPACEELIATNPKINQVGALGPYFIERVAAMVHDLGIIPAAWSDGLSHANPAHLPAVVQSNAWGTLYSGAHNDIHQMVNRGWDVVLSSPDVLYFDFPYEADPIEPGYYWGSRSTDTFQVFQFMPKNLPVHAEIWTDNLGHDYAAKDLQSLEKNHSIIGIQAQLWSETVRSNQQANYMLFPRLLAVAERAWHMPKWAEKYAANIHYSRKTELFDQRQQQQLADDWLSFSYRVSQHILPQLIKDGVIPRVSLPGAVVRQGKLQMNSDMSGLVMEYRTDNQTWRSYTQPVDITSEVDVRARVAGTRVVSRVQSISNINTGD